MKKWLLFFISLIQTILSIVIYNLIAPVFNGGLELQLGLVLFLVVIEVVLALLVSFVIRKYDVILPIILEVILAPLAVFRFVFGLILSLVFQQDFALEYDSSDLLSSVAEYLIYFEVSYKAAISKTGNLISILLFA